MVDSGSRQKSIVKYRVQGMKLVEGASQEFVDCRGC